MHPTNVVTVYTSHESSTVNPIIKGYQAKNGIKVELVAAGTGELLKRIEAEKNNPLADVIWGGGAESLDSYKHYFYPYKSIYDNVAYGLKARKVKKEIIREKVTEALMLVKMENLINRKPAELSGGQRQRVALARAIVIEPDLLLMDEPLSNLDAKLKVKMRNMIKELQKKLNITTIYVTHDQEEALSISDRIAVMKQGRISQIGEPHYIYQNPVNSFVADFIGTSNFCEGTITNIGWDTIADISIMDYCFQIKLAKKCIGKVLFSARPEDIILKDSSIELIRGTVQICTFLGDFIKYEILLPNGQVIEVNEYMKDMLRVRKVGDEVGVLLQASKVTVYNETGEEVLSEKVI
jgi:iron(III) transport system ATP-binding protein